jgi:hypothetical protein
MRYDDPAERAAYVAGFAEAVEATVLQLDPPHARELEGWLRELRDWTNGEPPPGPHRWTE